MTRFVSTDDTNTQRWIRSAALAINSLIPSVSAIGDSVTALSGTVTTVQGNVTTLQSQVAPLVAGHPFQQLATAPATPTEGQTYYDTVLHKLRVYDGTLWQNCW